MDLTQVFKAAALAKKVQLKTKLAQQKEDVQESAQEKQTRNKISQQRKKSTTQRDEFSKQAREVCHKITTLRNFLEENRAAYMHIGEHLRGAAQMTDEQRNLIDKESEKFFMHYTQYLARMREDWVHDRRKTEQQQMHMESVCELLCAYLRDVQNFYLSQKKHRLQYELDTYRMLKLVPDKKRIPEVLGGNLKKIRTFSFSSNDSGAESATDSSLLLSKNRAESVGVAAVSQLRHRFKHKKRTDALVDNEHEPESNNLATASRKVAVDADLQTSLDDQGIEGLTAEEIQLYERQNEEKYQELQGVSHELEIVEKNVVEVAQLQDILTENVCLQNYNIERIANAVVGATENVKDANEQIKQAIQRNAGLRVWSLFFLLVMSFALLFLDWYYD